MPRKTILALIILIFVLGLVAGGYFVLAARSFPPSYQINNPAGVTKEADDASPEAAIKLVYVGTNETLSEALYHLDLQDGKLDEPHIVFSVLEWNSNGEAIKKALKFVDRSGKVVKELFSGRGGDVGPVEIFETLPNIEPAEGSIKGWLIGRVRKDNPKEDIEGQKQTDNYFDAGGKFLFKEYWGYRMKNWSPDLSYRVDYPLTTYFFPPYEIDVRDRKGDLIGSVPFDEQKDDVVSNVYFSNNSRHFAAVFPVTNKLFVVDNKGGTPARIGVDSAELKILTGHFYPTNDGSKVFLTGFDSKGWVPGTDSEGRDRYLITLNRDGTKQVLYKCKEIQGFSISDNEKYLALATEKELVLIDLEKNYLKKIVCQGDLFEKWKIQILNIWVTDNGKVLFELNEHNGLKMKNSLFYAEDNKTDLISEREFFECALKYEDKIILVGEKEKEDIYKSILIYQLR